MNIENEDLTHIPIPADLPRGIWWDSQKQRYRVRKYKNNKRRGGKYFKRNELHLAQQYLSELTNKLSTEPAKPEIQHFGTNILGLISGFNQAHAT